MKRFLTLAAVLLMAVSAQAQDAATGDKAPKAPKTEKAAKAPKETTKWRAGDIHCAGCCGECECRLVVPKQTYINLSMSSMTANIPGALNTRSSKGGTFEVGRTFFFNGKKPLVVAGAAELRFGLDVSFLDLQFNEFDIADQQGTRNAYYGHIGMQMGPSVTVTPMRNLHVKLYGHYAPAFSVFTLGDNLDYGGMFGQVNYVTGGLHVSYKFITLGAEVRGSTAKLNKVSEENFGTDYEIPENLEDFDPGTVEWKLRSLKKVKAKFPGVRFTLGFRF